MKDKIAIVTGLLLFCCSIFCFIKQTEKNIVSVINTEASTFKDYVFILDAGHGGEDGGAVAYDGTLEKDLNLQICNNISLYFDILGLKYVLIRDGDFSVGDTSLKTIRERKVSDIHKRYEIINSYENSILISIHQNMFSVEKYSGAQIFYDAKNEASKEISDLLQQIIKNRLQPDNSRKIKKTDNSIYLLYKAERPSVMIECGFMSNPNELDKLKNSDYQSQLSYLITKGLIQYSVT